MGLPGKGGMAYQLWLRYELFRRRLTSGQFAASEADLIRI